MRRTDFRRPEETAHAGALRRRLRSVNESDTIPKSRNFTDPGTGTAAASDSRAPGLDDVDLSGTRCSRTNSYDRFTNAAKIRLVITLRQGHGREIPMSADVMSFITESLTVPE